MIKARNNVTAVLAGLLALGVFFASPAAAETGLEFTPVTPEANGGDFPILPGGNGPDEPDDPFVLVPFETLPMFPSASVAVSCTTETATVIVKNPSLNVFIATVSVDGSVVDSGNVGVKQQFITTFPLAENATKAIKVTRGDKSMLTKDVTRDCLHPAPEYQVLSNCDTELAHARLMNNGDDVAYMAVEYDGAPYALQAVNAHSSIDWLLAISPGETKSFTVRHGNSVVLGNETLDFHCATPVTEPPAKPETPDTKAPAKPETPTPNGGNGQGGGTTDTAGGSGGEASTKTNTNSSSESTPDISTEGEDVPETQVLGLGEEIEIGDITEVADLDEIVGEIAGPTTGGGPADAASVPMAPMKMAMIGLWLLVLVACGIVAVMTNRRRAQTA